MPSWSMLRRAVAAPRERFEDSGLAHPLPAWMEFSAGTRSGGVVVLVEDAAQLLPSADVESGDRCLIGDGWWQRAQWSGIADALVRAVGVVELFVLAQGVQ